MGFYFLKTIEGLNEPLIAFLQSPSAESWVNIQIFARQ